MENTTAAENTAVIDKVSMEKLGEIFEKIFATLKKVLAWLGILILPDEDEKEDYPKN